MSDSKTITGIMFLAVSSQRQKAKDKLSLPKQRTDALALAKQLNIDIPESNILVVPGFSRDESNVPRALERFRRQGVTAFDELERHWDAKDFKALITYHPSRAGRSKSLFSHVIENSVRAGATVYFIHGGKISPENFDAEFAIHSMVTRDDVNRLQSALKTARPLRIERGLAPMGSLPPLHNYTYDSRGKITRKNVDGKNYWLTIDRDRWQSLIDDLFDEFVHRKTAYTALEKAMAERGHLDNGKPYSYRHFEGMLKGPWTYGHLSTGHRSAKIPVKWGRYMIDEAYASETPESVKMAYNVVEPMYPPAQLEQLRSVVLVAHDTIRGRASRQRAYPFSGLLICGECGHSMIVKSKTTGWYGYRCRVVHSRDWHNRGITCSQGRYIRKDVVQEYVAGLLKQIYEGDPEYNLQNLLGEMPDNRDSNIQREIDGITAQLESLAANLSQVNFTPPPEFYRRAEELNQQRTVLQKELARKQQKTAARKSRKNAFASLPTYDPDVFWAQDNATINQQLRLILGDIRIVVMDAQIVNLIRKVK